MELIKCITFNVKNMMYIFRKAYIEVLSALLL